MHEKQTFYFAYTRSRTTMIYFFVYISLFLSHFDDDFSLMHVAVVDLQVPSKCIFGFFVVNADN